MEVSQETIILGLVILVVVLVLLNRSNEGFRKCTAVEKSQGRNKQTKCYFTSRREGKNVATYCKRIGGDWSRDGCPRTLFGKKARRCKCISQEQVNEATNAAKNKNYV